MNRYEATLVIAGPDAVYGASERQRSRTIYAHLGDPIDLVKLVNLIDSGIMVTLVIMCWF